MTRDWITKRLARAQHVIESYGDAAEYPLQAATVRDWAKETLRLMDIEASVGKVATGLADKAIGS